MNRIGWLRLFRFGLRLLLFPISLLLALGLYLVSFWEPVRIMRLNTSRVGHLGVDAEYALSEIEKYGSKFRLFMVPSRVDLPIANRALVSLWRKSAACIPSFIGDPLVWTIKVLRLDGRLIYRLPKEVSGRFNWGTDPFGVTADGTAHLKFYPRDTERALAQLQCMGLDMTKPVVCIHIRDGNYHAQHSSGHWKESLSWRNMSISNFNDAAQLLADRGFQVVRLGVSTSQRFVVADEKFIFDYANNGFRDEFLDVFLVARCSFMISTSSGIDSLSQTFRKPLYNVGVIAPSQLYIHRNIHSIVQRFISTVDGHRLTLSESMALPKITDRSLRSLKLRLQPNTPQQIADLAGEAAERFLGNWQPSNYQTELQTRFLALLPSEFRRFSIRGGIGSRFLEEHADWLN